MHVKPLPLKSLVGVGILDKYTAAAAVSKLVKICGTLTKD